MSLSLLKIWTFPDEVAIASLNQLLEAGYKVNTSSKIINIKIISALTGNRYPFFDDITNEIISDNFFLKRLEKAEIDGLPHDSILVRAIQESDNNDLKRILILQEKARIEEESKRQTLLENTYDEKLEDICQMNQHDGSNFYFNDPITGEKKLLEANKIFQYKDKCFDIDTIYKYVNEGGIINLDADYVKRFFNRFGVVDFNGLQLTTESLKKKTYHSDVRTLRLDNNNITSLRDTNLPKSITTLSVNNNPLKGGYFLNVEIPGLLFLSMKDCGFDKIDCEYLPQSLNILEISNNTKLTELHSLKNMRNLRKLDIRNTGIKKIDWTKFVTSDPKKKLIIYCDRNINFKKTKPDWIEVHNSD